MTAEQPAGRTDPLDQLAAMKERGKEPNSASVLNAWVTHAQQEVGLEQSQLGWLIASTVGIAALQRAIDADGRSRFVLKGGTYLQHRLSWSGRATKDVDGMVRGDIDEFLGAVDDALAQPWGPLTLSRSEVETIATPAKIIKPRRFDVFVAIKGKVWRRIKVEITPDEAGTTDEHDVLRAPSLQYFGLPSPDELIGIALRYQIAQKLHAGTDPHEPPDHINDRARDIVDLLLLRELVEEEHSPALVDIRQACTALFEARAAEARSLGRPERAWPPAATAFAHWPSDYAKAAGAGRIKLSMQDAIAEVNAWIAQIDAATQPL